MAHRSGSHGDGGRGSGGRGGGGGGGGGRGGGRFGGGGASCAAVGSASLDWLAAEVPELSKTFRMLAKRISSLVERGSERESRLTQATARTAQLTASMQRDRARLDALEAEVKEAVGARERAISLLELERAKTAECERRLSEIERARQKISPSAEGYLPKDQGE
eukprot:6193023-Pleurochrysis_carterae.AAC.1